MLPEKRKARRRSLERRVWIDLGDGSPVVECVLRDISNTGGKLLFTAPKELPDQFVLRLSMDGRVARKCRGVWKSGNEIGVTFLAHLVSGTLGDVHPDVQIIEA
ncbi:MAG: PilZ domain-containing protein [Rhizobiales bacterium]|nr:PilZ domain-containing protein [Hyphomicrobiales bacterium]